MRYFIFSLSLLFLSCKTSTNKKEVELATSKSVIKQEAPVINISKITIYSKDSLPITADSYEVNNKKPTILLCHQAGYSRGEYKETALELMKLGFSCIAIDQRSGKEVHGIINETSLTAKERGLSTSYLDAKQDIEAAIDYMYEINGNQPILLVGSSYSATLVLLIGTASAKVKSVVAFSPGEYYRSIDVKNSIKDISKPVFVTSSKKESERLVELISMIDPVYITHYKPQKKGAHGSKALWDLTEGNEDYWEAFRNFFKK